MTLPQPQCGTAARWIEHSSLHCDELVSLLKAMLTRFVGVLGPKKLTAMDRALAYALNLEI